MAVYYPVAAVALYVQMEEAAWSLPEELRATLEGQTPSGFRILPDGTWRPIPVDPEAVTSDAARRTLFFWTVPQQMRICRNPYREADECTVTIRWRDLPLDPRICRSIGIAAYLGCVLPEEWDRAVREGVAITAAEARGAKREVKSLISQEFLRFVGFADEITAEHSEGGDLVRLSCRDFTQGLIDTPVPTVLYRDIRWDRPIEDVVWDILQSYPGTRGLPLHIAGISRGSEPVRRSRTHRAGRTKKRSVRARRVREETYWDLLTDITGAAGLILYADVWQGPSTPVGSPTGRFVLATPRAIYTDATSRPVVDYVTGESWEEPLPSPTLVYGANILSYSITRRMGKVKVPAVELVCQDGKRVLRARYPTRKMASTISPTGLWAQDEVRQYRVQGFTSEADLLEAAKRAFEDLGRGELTLSLETDDLASFESKGTADLLEIRAGIPLRFVVAPAQRGAVVGTLQEIETMSIEALVALLEERGQPPDAARMLAEYLLRPEIRRILGDRWYVRQAEHEFGAEGYHMRLEAVNYIEARVEREISHA